MRELALARWQARLAPRILAKSLRVATPSNALAANGGSLVERIARILKIDNSPSKQQQPPRITMNKTLACIGTASLLLGSLIIVHARDTITRQEFERAAHLLEKGVEEGKLPKEAARAGIEGLRKALAEEDKRDRKPAAGERDQPKRDTGPDREHKPREIYARAEAEMKQAVKEGEITEEQARERLQHLRQRLTGDRENDGHGERDRPREDAEARDHSREETARAIGEGIGERLKQVGARLKKAVANGEMTADEAWAKWQEIKKTQVAPRIKAAVKEGKMSEQDAKAIWREIERAEVAEKLKDAVATGKMSEEDARAKWEAFEKKNDR